MDVRVDVGRHTTRTQVIVFPLELLMHHLWIRLGRYNLGQERAKTLFLLPDVGKPLFEPDCDTVWVGIAPYLVFFIEVVPQGTHNVTQRAHLILRLLLQCLCLAVSARNGLLLIGIEALVVLHKVGTLIDSALHATQRPLQLFSWGFMMRGEQVELLQCPHLECVQAGQSAAQGPPHIAISVIPTALIYYFCVRGVGGEERPECVLG
mmetsp:Transcript_25595/g.63502  ORF Transcript_25595/g.63502 Transcript_25595/m.63502 type:complete len:207 (-) Transcript_25595:1341-1961(-)